MSRWREIFVAEQRKLPRSASFHERGQATKRAAAIYHGKARTTRSNPGGMGLVKTGLMAVGAYTAYQFAKGKGWL